MIRKIALIGAATLLSVSLAMAQKSSSPESTAGGAQGTLKAGQTEQKAPKAKKAKKAKGGAGSSPESTAGGAQGTSKDPRQKK